MLEQFIGLARYNAWMNAKLYAACAGLLDLQRKSDQGAFFGSIHNTLNHILLGDCAWLGRFAGDEARFAARDTAGEVIPITALSQVLYADFEELRAQRERTDADLEGWVAAQTDASLRAEFSYRNSEGAQCHALHWAVLHLFNHQTHHRGQVTTLLSQQGVDVGATDLVLLFR